MTKNQPALVYEGTAIRDRADQMNMTDMWRAARHEKRLWAMTRAPAERGQPVPA